MGRAYRELKTGHIPGHKSVYLYRETANLVSVLAQLTQEEDRFWLELGQALGLNFKVEAEIDRQFGLPEELTHVPHE